MFADVRRGLTVAAVVHGATVTDTDGNEIDTTEFFGPTGDSRSRPKLAAERSRRRRRRRRSSEPTRNDEASDDTK